ncbi:MAG TPA: sialidase family protein [Planctomycetaceae bacterium]|nr:sialidase family protein [Planctomycetaceae bacterium]
MPQSSRAVMTRRDALQTAAVLAAGVFVGGPRVARASSGARIEETRVISQQPTLYHGWPTLARRKNGELLVVCSGGREEHVCPFGRVELMRSRDGGRTWTFPQVLIDGPIDDRDAGVVETRTGTLLVTTFTSLAFEPVLEKAEAADARPRSAGEAAGAPGPWPPERLARWQAARDRVSADDRQRALGVWMIRSTDGGVTWSAPFDCLVNSPHGPVPLSDGRLVYAGKDLWREGHRVGVCDSADDGETWRWLAEIPVRPGDEINNYHELHAVETADGRIVCHVRNHNPRNVRETLQTESSDGGKTWSVPRDIGVWGLPSHLARLRGGRLLMTYGHRRAPLGNQARVSDDHGRTWSDPILLSDDGITGDLGYPSTVQLDDDTLVTVWYEVMKDSPRAVLRQCRWSLT